MSCIKGLIFDLGNTLMYLDGEWQAVLAQGGRDLGEFLADRGFSVDPAQFGTDYLSLRRSLWARSRDEQVEYSADYALVTLLAQLGYEDVSEDLVERAMNTFFSFEESHWQAYPDSEAILCELSERGYRLALISNATYDPLIQRLVDKGGLRRWLDVVLSSAGVGIRKPRAEIFQKVLDQWGFSPLEAVMIGDMLQFDILGAHNIGMKGILAAWDLYPDYDEGGDGIIPDATAESLPQLPDVVTALGHQPSETEGQAG